MKKSLLALAVLGAFASAASAQSSVTLSGRLDAGVIRSNGQYSLGGSQSGYNAFSLSGTEDLGGGMRAFFLLNHRFKIENGAINTGGNASGTPGQFWRNSWVGLGGGFGDVRLGRILMPLQDVNGGYDAFDTGTVGQAHTGGIGATVRANSAIYYRTPNLGGLFAHAAIAAGEGQLTTATTNPNSERPIGFAVGYAAGPLSAVVAYDKNALDRKTIGLYGKYNFGVATLLGQYENGDTSATTKTKAMSVSVSVPMGTGRVMAGYTRFDPTVGKTVTKVGFGGEYGLSKRTLLYADVGKSNGGLGLSGVALENAKKAQFDLGVRHAF